MIIRDLLDLASKEKRKKERIKSAQKIAVGMSAVAVAGVATGILIAPKLGKSTWGDFTRKALNAVESLKDTVQQKAETVKDSSAHCAQDACNVITGVHGKTEGVKKDIKKGYHEITRDIHKTAENIEHELNKPVE